jgi:hypothetical protein
MLTSAVAGRAFVYVEDGQTTTRYEVDRDGSVLRADVFSRSRPSGQPISRPSVSTQDGRALQL